MARPLKTEKQIARSKILHSAAKLFIERGYSNTRIKDVASDSKIQYNIIFRMFNDKDTLLSELIGLVLEHQFICSEKYLKDVTSDKLFFYAFETTLQLYMAESIEHIREMYSVSYSLPHTSHKIYDVITSKLEEVFKEHLPELETKDFYELEIASAGIMRGFVTVPCTMYFTMERKVRRFLETTFKIYEVPKSRIEDAISFVSQFDMEKFAKEVIDSLFEYIISRT